MSPSTEVNASDEALIDRLAAAGLSDRETLLGAHEAAARQRRTLRDELVSAGLFTDYQLDAVTEGRDEGLHFGPALLLDVIHRGAVTTTYLARAPQHAEPIAVRVLASRWRVDEHMRASLEGSVAPFLTFRHEHVAATLQLLIVDDRFGLAVEYVDGLSLADLSGDAIPPAAMVDLCRQALSALAATHRAGLAHRNLRPSRLMVDRLGALKVLGYGEPDWLSKVHRCERRRTSTPYLAPEQRSGDVPADARVDVYALGTIFKDLADVAQRTDPDGYESGGLAERFLPLLGRMTAEAFCERPSAGEALGELERITQARLGSGPAWPEAPAVIDRRRSQPNRAA